MVNEYKLIMTIKSSKPMVHILVMKSFLKQLKKEKKKKPDLLFSVNPKDEKTTQLDIWCDEKFMNEAKKDWTRLKTKAQRKFSSTFGIKMELNVEKL